MNERGEWPGYLSPTNAPADFLRRSSHVSGRILSNQDALTLNLRLEDGSIHRSGKGKGEEYQTVDFTTYDINLNIGQQAMPEARPKKASEISTAELLRDPAASSPLEGRKLAAELRKRLILPLAPMLFALVAVPLGIRVQRSGRGGGFALGLLVFLTYYLLQSFTETLAIEGGWPMAMLWLPTLFFCAGGLFLLLRTAREQSFFHPIGFLQFVRKVFRRQSLESR